MLVVIASVGFELPDGCTSSVAVPLPTKLSGLPAIVNVGNAPDAGPMPLKVRPDSWNVPETSLLAIVAAEAACVAAKVRLVEEPPVGAVPPIQFAPVDQLAVVLLPFDHVTVAADASNA